MEGFKKEKTADFQLFKFVFKHFFCDFERTQKSALFRQNSNNEKLFLEKLK